MSDAQLRILGKEYFGDKDLVGRELTGRNCFAVLDPFLWINQHRAGFFCDGVVIRPLCQDVPCGVHQINLDPLVRRKVERHRALGQICERHFDSELANLRKLYGLRRDLEIESEPAQPWIFVLRDHVWRKWVQNAAQPTASSRRRRWRRFLAKNAPGHKKYEKEQENAALHESRIDSPKVFGVAKFLSNPLSIGMKIFGAIVLCLLSAPVAGVAKQRHCTFRVHAQANPRDTEVFATSGRAQVSGKEVAIEKMPWISERDVSAFSPYPAQDGTYGALIQLDEHARVVLDTLSIERRGKFLFVFINGRFITELHIDKRVSDGQIYIPSGLTAADIDLMKKDWRLIGQKKK